MKTNFIIDFDSTFVTVESLDELANIALQMNSEGDRILSQIKDITNQGMDGTISFQESLKRRIPLLSANKHHIDELVSLLLGNISPSVQRNRQFFLDHRDEIYIISGGFREFISPVVSHYDLSEQQILANSFIFNDKDEIIGYDETNPLAQELGKPKAVESLELSGRIVVIGDGFTDYQIREQGFAERFIAYTETVNRPVVTKFADKVVTSFDDIVHEYYPQETFLSKK